jgi:hypothetical protein
VSGDGSPDDPVPDDAVPDDAAQLARYSAELADAIDVAVVPWLVECVATRTPGHEQEAGVAAEAARREVVPLIRDLLATDIDAQRATPLQLLRRGTAPVTRMLADAGAIQPVRDEVSRRLDPDDLYDLGPVAYADLGPEVAEAGLVWGAAKAHVHLRRRRSSS